MFSRVYAPQDNGSLEAASHHIVCDGHPVLTGTGMLRLLMAMEQPLIQMRGAAQDSLLVWLQGCS